MGISKVGENKRKLSDRSLFLLPQHCFILSSYIFCTYFSLFVDYTLILLFSCPVFISSLSENQFSHMEIKFPLVWGKNHELKTTLCCIQRFVNIFVFFIKQMNDDFYLWTLEMKLWLCAPWYGQRAFAFKLHKISMTLNI